MAASQGNLDVAIIGGGIAGLYCLYRLLSDSKYKNKNIKLFEASNHLGGRIETWSLMREVPGKYDTGFTDTWDPRLPLWDGCHATPEPYDPLDKLDCFRTEFGPMRIEPRDQPRCGICSMSWTSQNKLRASQNLWTISFFFFLCLGGT